jgi:1D-myo-inositol 3-kinase
VSTYVAIGSVCWDVVEGEPERRMGGSVLFASRTAVAQGWDAHLITSGTPELETALRAALPDVEITVQPSAHDTVMAFSREADLGPRSVPTLADPIDLARAPGALGGADVVHLAPIMGEVDVRLVGQVAGSAFVGITPQGLLRTRDERTHALGLLDAPGAWWAEGTDAVVLSESEYERIAVPLDAGGRAVAVTRGERGCFGRRGDEVVDLPGVPIEGTSSVGTIGAGDVFSAALFLALAGGDGFAAAMDRANRRAAAHVGGQA